MHSIDNPPVKNSGEARKKYKRFVSKQKGDHPLAWVSEYERWLAFHFDGRSPKVLNRTVDVIPAPHVCKKLKDARCYACELKLKPRVLYLVDVELEREGQCVIEYYQFSEFQLRLFVKTYVQNNLT